MTETYDFETANFMRHGLARKNVIRIAVGIIALLFFFFLSPFGTIAAGERGVHLRFTAVTGKVFGEGLYFRFPLIEFKWQPCLGRIALREDFHVPLMLERGLVGGKSL